ncbi:MAG: hypothetical protein IPJ26_04365 [Bacteroidetes bacterium]|nr:hypothetical protein [Bacteroidota bacterium]
MDRILVSVMVYLVEHLEMIKVALFKQLVFMEAAAPLTIGVYGISTEATTDASDYIGVKGEAVNDPGISSTSAYYGVYGSAPSQTCSNTSCAGAAGYFNGDVYASADYIIVQI